MGVGFSFRRPRRLLLLSVLAWLFACLEELKENAIDTGDPQWNDMTIAATTWQAGTNGQFNPSNQSFDMGNDDQAFWTFTAMNAAETNFPPPTKGYPSWADMGQIVFNEQATRWDTVSCGGGLHWQVYQTSQGCVEPTS